MARESMAELIADLRRLANAGADDHQVGDVSYWTDDQIQAVLDQHSKTHKGIELAAIPEYVAGQVITVEYVIPSWIGAVERAGVGSGWAVRDASGNDAPAHTVNYDAGRLEFESDTGAQPFYLSCRSYDLSAAAAAVWEAKAGFVADSVDWRSDNHQIAAAQEYEHCRRQAERFRELAGGRVVSVPMFRSDEA